MSASFSISRRQLIKSAAAAGALSYTYLQGSGQAFAQQAKRLIVGVTPPATQATLGFMTETEGSGPLQPMYEFLTMSDRFTGAIGPNLASEWQSSADAKQWHLKLRPDVTFHNGKPFTAQDVVKSWELLTLEDSRATTASYFRKLIASADSFEIVNDHEIVFHLERAEPELPYYLSQAQGFIIYSKDYWDSVGRDGYAANPIGTGPFKFVEFRVDQYILYNRVENHWRQTPEFAELQIMYMPEDATRLAALLAGEVHIAEISRSLQNQAVARGKQIVTSTRPAASISARFGGNYLNPKGEPGPLANKLVRQAMNLAVNRDEINQQIFGGRGTPAAVEGFQSTDPEFDPAWTPYPFDPDQAKALLTQAGYANGFSFDMTVVTPTGFPELPTVVEAMGIYFTNIGLSPNLVQMEFADQNNRQRAADFYNTLYSGRNSVRPLFRAMEYFSSKGIYHFFEDPYLEQRVDSFAKSLDPKERSGLIKEVGDFLYKNYADISLLNLYAEIAVDPTVVAEYKADIGAFGASIGHEYTKAA
ncbi:MAG TPA: ABC transporter substrate-binding protein [Devosiaceae bacterium]|jgi:peptide/nickel transport system substrate-binding protein